MNNAFIELMSIDFPGPAVDFRQCPTVKALPLLQHFQGDFVRIFDGVFHIPVIHLQCHREQCACEMIENRDRIFSFHQRSLPTDSRLAIQESKDSTQESGVQELQKMKICPYSCDKNSEKSWDKTLNSQPFSLSPSLLNPES